MTYLFGILLGDDSKSTKHRKTILILGCSLPLCSLVLFKYYGFINTNVTNLLEYLGIHIQLPEMRLLLPLGISFYTFAAIGYLMDLYHRKYEPERNFGIFCLFIGFFAQVTSGPIPRGNQLIPQLRNPDRLSSENVLKGIHEMVWGFFMKLCVADRLGIYVDTIFGNIQNHNGGSMLLASLLYTVQIYSDFAGYSLIAIGTARMLGIHLIENFKRPYFAKSIKEFWSRWHISLSSWFRDYVYIPLGGNRVSSRRNKINLLTTFLVSGLWHGSAWNFILWGGMHGYGQIIEKRLNGIGVKVTLPSWIKICFVFAFVSFCWIFFRLDSIEDITSFFKKVITDLSLPFFDVALVYGGLSLLLLMAKDYVDEYHPQIKLMASKNLLVSSVSSGIVVSIIMLFGAFGSESFIYFQF